MKKIAVLTLALLMLAGCSTSSLKTGLGMVTSRSATAATAEAEGSTQADTTACALTVDAKGKIISVSIDVTQAKVKFDATGKVVTDVSEAVRSKKALKEEYDMKKASGIGKEWYEQMAEFEKWATGKTVAEVTGMKTKVKDEKHPAVPDVAELASTVTMDVSDFLEAVKRANENVK